MNCIEPTDEEIRTIFLETPQYLWPTFEHMPLNCFDLGVGLLVFPGDISKDRARDPAYFADYKIDINDESTCPKMCNWSEIEFWNESSKSMRWFLGRIRWACMIDRGDYVLKNGYFGAGVGVVRFQNIPWVNDVQEVSQLKKAVEASIEDSVSNGTLKPLHNESFLEKDINGSKWLIGRSLNGLGYPEYFAVLPIDYRTVIHVAASLDNCWQRDETIPDVVEQKHLASFWDFLSQVHLILDHSGGWEVGSQAREAPGQAEKENDFQW